MAKTQAEPPGRSGSQFFVVIAADAGLPPDTRCSEGELGPGRRRSDREPRRPGQRRDGHAAGHRRDPDDHGRAGARTWRGSRSATAPRISSFAEPAAAPSGSATFGAAGWCSRFYPGDFTPVCTRQFCSYRDAADRLDELDAEVLGVSPQSLDSHERFRAKHGLTVPLLADPERTDDPRLWRPRPRRPGAPLDLHRRPRGNRALPPRRPARAPLPGRRGPEASRSSGRRPRRRPDAGEPAIVASAIEPAEFAVGRTAAGSPASRSGTARRSCSCTGSPPPAATSSTAPRSWLGAGHRQISYDARGHGESDPAPPGEGYSLPASWWPTWRRCSTPRWATGAWSSPATRWAPHRGRLRARARRAACRRWS